jgi:hypothetical protein
MNEVELSRIERRLREAMCSASDNGGVELLEAASYSTSELARLLALSGEQEREPNRGARDAFAEPRGSRCLCPACKTDYRLMSALG